MFGILLGTPTLKLRGDYLAIVTLGFGEIVRIFMNNLSQPVNITNGPQGITLIDPFTIGGMSFRDTDTLAGLAFGSLVQLPGIGGGPQVVAAVVLHELFAVPLEAATSIAKGTTASSLSDDIVDSSTRRLDAG